MNPLAARLADLCADALQQRPFLRVGKGGHVLRGFGARQLRSQGLAPLWKAIGAAHAGWKGAIGGVTDRTVEAMEALGADRARIAAVATPAEPATSLRVRAGKVETMDGPFAETREHLGGFYLLELPDLDAALRYAAQIPVAHFGTIEVRPVMDYDLPDH